MYVLQSFNQCGKAILYIWHRLGETLVSKIDVVICPIRPPLLISQFFQEGLHQMLQLADILCLLHKQCMCLVNLTLSIELDSIISDHLWNYMDNMWTWCRYLFDSFELSYHTYYVNLFLIVITEFGGNCYYLLLSCLQTIENQLLEISS